MAVNALLSPFLRRLSESFLLIILVGITFYNYVLAEKEIGRANEIRLTSHILSNQLRQSSDDLTRMVRTYVVTGNPLYKQHYQEILDIRNGKTARPQNYENVYWDLVLSDDKRPSPSTGTGKPLLELMREAGFASEELNLLSQAKANSDHLTQTEYAAMRLIEARPHDESVKKEAVNMLHDLAYHQAKASIMKPIRDFEQMVFIRTTNAVHQAEQKAMYLRFVFVTIGLLMFAMLYRLYRSINDMLGGTIDDLEKTIAQISSDEYAPSSLHPQEGTVLSWILQAQKNLFNLLRQNRSLNQLYETQSYIAKAIISCEEHDCLFKALTQNIVRHGGMAFASIAIPDKSSNRFVMTHSYGAGHEYFDGIVISFNPDDPEAHGPTGQAYLKASSIWCQNFFEDPMTAPWHERGRQYGWGSSAALPLMENGDVVAVFTLYSPNVNAFEPAIQKLLEDITSQTEFAFDTLGAKARRRETENTLVETNRLLQTIINTVPIRIFWKDRQLHYIGCNDLFAQDAGLQEAADLIGKDDYQMGWKEQANLYRADDQHVIDTRIRKLFYEEPQTTPDGERIWLSTSKVPLIDGFDNVIGVLGMYQDITESKRAVEALKEERNKAQSYLDIVGVMILVLDREMNVVLINQTGARLVGYEPHEIIGKNWIDHFIPERFRTTVYKIGEALSNEGESEITYFENPVITRSGTERLIAWRNRSLFNGEGERIGLITSGEDITELRDSEHALRDSETRLRAVIDNEPECVKLVDLDGKLIDMNPAGIALLEADSLDEVQTSNLADFVLPKWKTPYSELLTKAMNGENGRLEYEILGLKGGYRWVETNTVPLRNRDGTVTMMLGITRDITERKISEEQIHYLANFDMLTGLPNRLQLDNAVKDLLSLSKRNQSNLAIMFLDLDRFKEINDSLGHAVGDTLLVETAKRIQSILREEDMVARLGGDEFIFLLQNTSMRGAASVASKVLKAFESPYFIEHHELNISGSIGIALYPNDGEDFGTLYKNADTAMYRSKQAGRNGFCFFTEEMQRHSLRNLELINAMRHSLERNEFSLYYQPQYSSDTHTIIGAEALLRWNHPKLGAISPAEFIPVAEESNFILTLGEWVIRTAAAQAKIWLKKGYGPLIMAVNLSAVQFKSSNLLSIIESTIQETALPPEYLELELTESVAMNDPEQAIRVMNELHKRGIRMSIDDFGTGYSSLSYLKKFQVYKLKIDQSFVRDLNIDPEDRAIIQAIISMAKSLGLQTIAEGVETIGQAEFLKQHGCDEFQGYYFSRPLPADEFEKLFQP
ncbi:MAG: EAL domain-containing protein [Sulfuricurvum sp.]